MANEVVLDIETYGDIKDHSNLKITVVSIYEYEPDRYTSFGEHELGNLWPIFEKAERLIGFNSEYFDLPILNRYYTGDLTKFPHLDLLKIIKDSSGTRFKLNDIAKATLQIEKNADGLQAMKWYEAGEIDEIKKYCEQDVKITKEIYDFGRKNRMLYYPTISGDIMPIAVNFEPPAKIFTANNQANASGINLTLPF